MGGIVQVSPKNSEEELFLQVVLQQGVEVKGES